MPGSRALRILPPLALVNSLICLVTPVVIVLHPGGARAVSGEAGYFLAAAVLALTPLQILALWLVLGGHLRDQNAVRRTKSRIDGVIRDEQMQTAFQPIVDLRTGQVIGVEALTRFDAEPPSSPDEWFADAAQVGDLLALELLALTVALSRVPELPQELDIALNLSPSTLTSGRVLPLLLRSSVADRLVVEITEHSSVDDYPSLRAARAELQQHGIRLAVDDAGSGYASFQHIVALAPDIIKIDRTLIRGIEHDRARQALVAAVVMFALQCGAAVVGEGVETAAELHTLETLGVDSAQGFFLGRPTTSPQEWQAWRPHRSDGQVRDNRPDTATYSSIHGAI